MDVQYIRDTRNWKVTINDDFRDIFAAEKSED